MASDPKTDAKPTDPGRPITLVCECGKKLSVKSELAGKKIKCPSCRAVLVVPSSNSISQTQTESVSAHDPHSQTIDGNRRPNRDLYSFLAAPQADDEIGRLGPYRVLKVLGAGGMGVVFKAEDPGLKRLVALKAMLPSAASSDSARERFLREARTAAALKHDHIVSIFQVGEDRGVPYLAMEFLAGESLDDCLKREGRLPVADILRIGRELTEGLAAAHERGVIHRDIKPANIWMETSPLRLKSTASSATGKAPPRAKILDFGLARAGSDSQLTQSGIMVGTPAYMPPEQASGKKVDQRCDLYSLGVVLYKMATGEVPFKGDDTISILSALALETPVEPATINPSIPIPLNDLIVRLLAKKADDRPASAEEVFAALNEIEDAASGQAQAAVKPTAKKTAAAGVAAIAKPAPATGSPRPPKSKRWPLIAIGGSVVLIAIVFGFVFLWPTPQGTVIERPVAKFDPSAKDKVLLPPVVAGEEMTNSIGMKLVSIPPGKFLMGSPADEKERDKGEVQHEVEITKGFWLGKYEVTQEEYEKVMGTNPSMFKGPRLPVENVSWHDAKEFCKKLSAKEGKEYTLPTEAEWEYACRAGTKGPFSTGDKLTMVQANANGEFPYAGSAKEEFRGTTTEVGSFAANGFGLCDMHGNVNEWCEDWGGPYETKEVPSRDPKGPTLGGARLLRGGAWRNHVGTSRSAFRGMNNPSNHDNDLGFRVVLRSGAPNVLPPKENTIPVPPPVKVGEEITNGIGMKLVAIPAGKFLMGSPKNEIGRRDVEIQHQVEITKGFWLGKFEVTQEEYEKIMGSNPSEIKGPRLPVGNLQWSDAKEFCRKLSEKEGKEYTLPTEAEWEYACRAGTTGPFSTGDNLTTAQANYDGDFPYAANAKGIKREQPLAVGSFAANGWGLHDMHGNVYEWCEDWRVDQPTADPVRDPTGPPKRTGARVFRGGSWATPAEWARSADRGHADPFARLPYVGLRVVLRSLVPAKPTPPPTSGLPFETTNSIGMKLVAIPPGKFLMGSPANEKERQDNEAQHDVEITKGFWLGKYEVTQEEYEKVMGSNPSYFKGPKLPVEQVSWDNAKTFCLKLSMKEGKEYTLPTEAEWEYACRAGTTGPFSTGDNLTADQANYNGAVPYAGNAKGLNRGRTVDVGSFAANGFGLHDMHGNVWEWCEDWLGDYETGRPLRDPKGPSEGTLRVVRGGGWIGWADICRSASRNKHAPTPRDNMVGFRVVLRSAALAVKAGEEK